VDLASPIAFPDVRISVARCSGERQLGNEHTLTQLRLRWSNSNRHIAGATIVSTARSHPRLRHFAAMTQGGVAYAHLRFLLLKPVF
jgi:hypothetical protein